MFRAALTVTTGVSFNNALNLGKLTNELDGMLGDKNHGW